MDATGGTSRVDDSSYFNTLSNASEATLLTFRECTLIVPQTVAGLTGGLVSVDSCTNSNSWAGVVVGEVGVARARSHDLLAGDGDVLLESSLVAVSSSFSTLKIDSPVFPRQMMDSLTVPLPELPSPCTEVNKTEQNNFV